MVKLSTILGRYHSIVMREAIRTHRRRLVLESRQPQTGAYYWVPRPVDNQIEWIVLPFYDRDYNNTLHQYLWPQVLEYLSLYWDKDNKQLKRRLRDNYTALPRGRISSGYRAKHNQLLLMHGGDSPGPLQLVKRTFNLTKADVKDIQDSHEQMISGDPEELQRELGVDLGLKGILMYV